MTKVLAIALAAALLFGSVGCNSSSGGPSPTTVKLLLQTAATTFESAMTLLNVQWANAKFDQDINAPIAAWQVGANWKTQVIGLLGPVSTDISQIACGTNIKCQQLTTILSGAVQSVIADLGGTPTKAGLPHYGTYAQYREAWDAAAPEGAKL